MQWSLSRRGVRWLIPGATISVALICTGGAARAGCSSVGCSRIDWTEEITTAGDESAAVDFHGAFVWGNASTGWSPFPMQGHFVARCAASQPSCQDQLAALRAVAGTQTAVSYNPDAISAADFIPSFLAREGQAPETVLSDGMPWPVPNGTNGSKSFCALALSRPRNSPPCPGDCDGSGEVTIEEIVRGLRIALEALPLDGCASMDASHDGAITVDEVVRAVDYALQSCP